MKNAYELFQEILVGDFDNRNQVALEQAAGKQVHPFAVHVNRIFTHRVEGFPKGKNGCYILEESYYTYPNQEVIIKPHLFFIEPHTENSARLTPIQIPAIWALEDIRNDNPEFKLKYEELQPIPWFSPATYHKVGERMHVHHTVQLEEGKQFSLIEFFTKNRLDVMELLEQNGKRLISYSTPIIYERLP